MGKRLFLKTLLIITGANYIAQVPYYIHQYYTPYHAWPNVLGTVLLGLTLAWFILGYYLLASGRESGYWLTLAFLAVEFLFYLQTQVSQLIISHQLFLHVYHPNGLTLFFVFGIGYMNFLASAYFMIYLLRHKKAFVS